MANKRVRDMTASSALTGPEKFYADNGSIDTYVTADQIASFASTASTTGGWLAGSSVSVADFGSVGDGVTDDWAAIQGAIDYALEHNITTVLLPQGEYVISSTIMLGYGYSFATIQLIGEVVDARADAATGDTPILLPNFVDRAVVAIQGGRNSGLENISIAGPVLITDNIGGEFLNAAAYQRADGNNYVPLDCLNNDNAAYCAVCVDPYSGSQPASAGNRFPLVAIPSFLGHGSNITYGRSATSTFFVRKCKIRDTLIGVLVGPNDSANKDSGDLSGTE